MSERPLTIAIIGGKLQGTEAVYLAGKAGMRTILIDKRPDSPASGLADLSLVADVCKPSQELTDLLATVDFLLPALENDEALAAMAELAKAHGLPMAFDGEAYAITSSKRKSDRLMKEACVPVPLYYPEGQAPYIIKPSEESGSVGVRKAESAEVVMQFYHDIADLEEWVVQEYLEGKSYSIEVIGKPGNYQTYAVTEIHMDEIYDCRMVTCPCPELSFREGDLQKIALQLAELVHLHGIMDVEVIDAWGQFNTLEIDARIPSQTPAAVFHSTGVNFVEELAWMTLYGRFPERRREAFRRCTAYEHYLLNETGVFSLGEHIMSEARPLTSHSHLFGADEVVCDYDPKENVWRGIFINTADTSAQLEEKRQATKAALEKSWKEQTWKSPIP